MIISFDEYISSILFITSPMTNDCSSTVESMAISTTKISCEFICLISFPKYLLVTFLSMNKEDLLKRCMCPWKCNNDDLCVIISSGQFLKLNRSVQVLMYTSSLSFFMLEDF